MATTKKKGFHAMFAQVFDAPLGEAAIALDESGLNSSRTGNSERAGHSESVIKFTPPPLRVAPSPSPAAIVAPVAVPEPVEAEIEAELTGKHVVDDDFGVIGEEVAADEVEPIETESANIQPVSQPVTKPVAQPVVNTTPHPTRKAAHQPVTQPVIKPVSNTAGQPVIQPDTEPVTEPVDRLDSRSGDSSHSRSVIQPVTLPVTQPVSQPVTQPLTHPFTQPVSGSSLYLDPIFALNKNHVHILYYLIIQRGIAVRKNICEATGIPWGTMRDTLISLVKKGYISKPAYFVNGQFRGFSYTILQPFCDDFLCKRGHEFEGLFSQPVNQPIIQPLNHPLAQPVRQLDTQPDSQPVTRPVTQPVTPFSSSSLEDISTTTKTVNGTDAVLTGAVGAYWEEEGLGEPQTKKWCAQFEVEPAVMRQQLEWCRFDLEDNGKRADVKKDAVSLFFGYLRKTGGSYPRPVNYRSPVEIRAEAMETDLAKEKDARARLAAAEIEKEFQSILADPEGEAYKSLLGQTNEFARDIGGQALETVLREIFVKGRGVAGTGVAGVR